MTDVSGKTNLLPNQKAFLTHKLQLTFIAISPFKTLHVILISQLMCYGFSFSL